MLGFLLCLLQHQNLQDGQSACSSALLEEKQGAALLSVPSTSVTLVGPENPEDLDSILYKTGYKRMWGRQ